MEQQPPRRIGRSILALFAGFVLVVIFSIAADAAMRAAGLFPPPGQPAADGPLALATIYRTIFGIAGSYLTARLAPRAPMGHALIGGAVGQVLSIAGAAVAWSHPEKFGPHWYPLALVILAMPTAWTGGRIYTSRGQRFETA